MAAEEQIKLEPPPPTPPPAAVEVEEKPIFPVEPPVTKKPPADDSKAIAIVEKPIEALVDKPSEGSVDRGDITNLNTLLLESSYSGAVPEIFLKKTYTVRFGLNGPYGSITSHRTLPELH